MRIDDAVSGFLAHRRAKGLSRDSLDRYAQALRRWQRWRTSRQRVDDLAAVDADELRGFITYLLDEHIPHGDNPRRHAAATAGMAPASVLSTRNVLRAFWTFAAGEGWLRDDQRDYFQGDRIPRPKVVEEPRPYWDDATVDGLLAACEGRPAEEIARNRAIILLLVESGMRLDELAHIELGIESCAARIAGKGGKWRWVFWTERTEAAIRSYLALRRGPAGGALFRGTSRVNDGGADIGHVAQLLGHSDVQTTMRYTRERKDKLQEVHRRAMEVRKRRDRERAQRLRRRRRSDQK